FTAYRNIAAERFDFVFHYGDYIYEGPVLRPNERKLPVVRVMPGDPDECYTLDDYRHRYSLHQLDADLQAAHASAPFVMSYDDHEVENDWAGDTNEKKAPPELFVLRRAAAFQAWYEHLPLRRAQRPRSRSERLRPQPRQVGRCRGRARPAVRRGRGGEAPESGRRHRRRSPELGGGAEEEFRRREICDARRRVRGDVGFLARR